MSYQVYLFFLIAGLVFVPCPQSQILETNKETIENLKSNDAICRRPKAILNTDIIKDTNSNHHQSFVILGADTNNYFGFGNKLIFSSAAYYFAAITGRDILIEDKSVLGLACQHIHCGFPLRSIQFPDNYREHKIGSYSIPLVEESDNLLSFYNNQTYSGYHNNVILDGYNGGERFWERVKEAESCCRHLSGCQLQHAGSPHTTDSDSDISRSFVACMNGYAISELMTGPLKIPTDLSSLVGMDQSSEIFRIPFRDLINTKPSEIDIAIHLRLQFDGFEKYQTVNASMYQNEVEKWMSTDTYKNLCTAMSTKVCEILSAKSVIDSQSVNTNKKSYSIYLAADNAIVKQALFNHIQNSIGPSTSSTCQSVHLPLKMMMLNVSSILHTSFIDDPLKINHNISHIKRKMMKKKSKRKKRRKKNKKNKYAESREYATMFDWYMISTANQLLNWARFENRYRYYYSTYTQTSRYLKTISNKTSGGQSDYTLKINGLEAPVWIAKDKLYWG